VDFGDALRALRNGQAVRRLAWYTVQSVMLGEIASAQGSTIPALMGKGLSGSALFWHPSPTDLLAEDWEVVLDG